MPRTPLTAMGICGERRELDGVASGSILGAARPGTSPSPGLPGDPGSSPPVPTPRQLSWRGPAVAVRQMNQAQVTSSQVRNQRPSDLQGTSRCSNPNSSLFR